jgi:hypothetical protein
MFCLYQRIGYHGTKSGMETRAAVDAGQAVREEVRAFNRRTKTEYAVLKTVEGRIMMKNTLLLAACATAMLSLAAVPHANAGGTESHEMYLTFSAPFALPGVSLPAGTYAFELLNNQGVLKAVRVTSKDGLRVYLTALTLTVSRPIGQPKDRLISFAEVETGRTPVVQAWYPKDDSVGHEFIYPKHRPQVATH